LLREYNALWMKKYERQMTVSKILYTLAERPFNIDALDFSMSSQ
jgi:hypothetical protein